MASPTSPGSLGVASEPAISLYSQPARDEELQENATPTSEVPSAPTWSPSAVEEDAAAAGDDSAMRSPTASDTGSALAATALGTHCSFRVPSIGQFDNLIRGSCYTRPQLEYGFACAKSMVFDGLLRDGSDVRLEPIAQVQKGAGGTELWISVQISFMSDLYREWCPWTVHCSICTAYSSDGDVFSTQYNGRVAKTFIMQTLGPSLQKVRFIDLDHNQERGAVCLHPGGDFLENLLRTQNGIRHLLCEKLGLRRGVSFAFSYPHVHFHPTEYMVSASAGVQRTVADYGIFRVQEAYGITP